MRWRSLLSVVWEVFLSSLLMKENCLERSVILHDRHFDASGFLLLKCWVHLRNRSTCDFLTHLKQLILESSYVSQARNMLWMIGNYVVDNILRGSVKFLFRACLDYCCLLLDSCCSLLESCCSLNESFLKRGDTLLPICVLNF